MKWLPATTKNFTAKEMACKCGECDGLHDMDQKFMNLLQSLRNRVGSPLTVTSGFRCPSHPDEVKKAAPGAHSAGLAADIACADSKMRYQIQKAAIEVGMLGIGIAGDFIHVDGGHPNPEVSRPASWLY